jgi:hypothetical protein
MISQSRVDPPAWALRLGIMIDRYNSHPSRRKTVPLSVAPGLGGKLLGALFGVGLFLNPHLLEQRFWSLSSHCFH